MIKIIAKLLQSPDKIGESSIGVDLEIPQKTKTELFDDAVKKVVRSELHKVLYDELCSMCHEDDELKQAEEWIKKYNDAVDESMEWRKKDEIADELHEAYPLARDNVSYEGGSIGWRVIREFQIHKFISKILEKELP